MFNLITWNIQSGRGPDGVPDLGRVAACLDRLGRLGRHDVVCLQEVASGFDPGGEDQFAALRDLMPGHVAVAALACDLAPHASAPKGPRRRLGSMILSRHPVLQVLRHSLPWPADPATPSMPRVALEATLDTPGGLLRVTTAHLAYFSGAQRLAQVQQLREIQREACLHARLGRRDGAGPFAAVARPAPALLAGDFNMLPGSREHRCLLAPFGDATAPLHDCWELTQPGRRHAPTVGLHDQDPDAAPPFTFDYVFASADLAPRVRRMRIDASEQGSAHQAVLVELEWGPD